MFKGVQGHAKFERTLMWDFFSYETVITFLCNKETMKVRGIPLNLATCITPPSIKSYTFNCHRAGRGEKKSN